MPWTLEGPRWRNLIFCCRHLTFRKRERRLQGPKGRKRPSELTEKSKNNFTTREADSRCKSSGKPFSNLGEKAMFLSTHPESLETDNEHREVDIYEV